VLLNLKIMIAAQVADEIFRIFALKENQDLSNEAKKDLVARIVIDVYNKGRRSGHNKAVEICKNALKGLENANSAMY
jgi:hypothetical protein